MVASDKNRYVEQFVTAPNNAFAKENRYGGVITSALCDYSLGSDPATKGNSTHGTLAFPAMTVNWPFVVMICAVKMTCPGRCSFESFEQPSQVSEAMSWSGFAC